MRARSAALLALVVVALGGCGGGGDVPPPEPADLGPDPASIVPPRSPLYAELVVRPEGEQRAGLEAALSKLLGTGDPGLELRRAIDKALRGSAGFTYTETVEPWLGQRIGAFAFRTRKGELGGGVAIAVTDVNEALTALAEAGDDEPAGDVRERLYRGVPYAVDSNGLGFGFVADFLVVASEPAMRAAIDASADERALAGEADYRDAREQAPAGGLLSVYGEADEVAAIAATDSPLGTGGLGGLLAALAGSSDQGGELVITGTATAAGFEFDVLRTAAGEEAGDQGTDPFELVPGNAVLALAAPARELLGGFAEGAGAREAERLTGLDPAADILPWAGDLGVYAVLEPPLTPIAGFELRSDDSGASARALERLEQYLRRRSAGPVTAIGEADAGFVFRPPQRRAVIAPRSGVVQLGDRIVGRVGGADSDALLSAAEGDGPEEPLAGTERFGAAREALGEGLRPIAWADLAAIADALGRLGVLSPQSGGIAGVLAGLDYAIAGVRSGSGGGFRVFVAVRDHGGEQGDPVPGGLAAVVAP